MGRSQLQRHRGRTEPGDGEAGMSLVEVMVAIFITAILVMGLSSLWTRVNDQFLYLTLRQKAIFVLNGEMERLTAMIRYRDTAYLDIDINGDGDPNVDGDPNNAISTTDLQQVDFISNDPTAAAYDDEFSGSVDGTPNDTIRRTRHVYRDSSAHPALQNILTTSAADFQCSASATPKTDAECLGRILFDENSAIDPRDDRNYVWIDRARMITGKLSFSFATLLSVGNAACYSKDTAPPTDPYTEDTDDVECWELRMYLQYPFRYQSATEPNGDAGFGKLETLVLKTIVGRR
jgi:Tfp pilus assembly protein PilV